jgi:hypothetical protein
VRWCLMLENGWKTNKSGRDWQSVGGIFSKIGKL